MTDKMICYCIGVTENEIVQAIEAGARNLKDIQKATNACTGNECKEKNPKGRCCSVDILEIVKREVGTESKGCKCCCCGKDPEDEGVREGRDA